jgi:hypothetical protein
VNPRLAEALSALPDLSAGAIALPTLTREELAVLADDLVLHDLPEEEAWAELPAATRSAIHDCVLRGLIARELAEPCDQGLLLDDRVRFLLGVRSSPAFVVVGDEVGTPLRQSLRGYGVDLAGRRRHDGVLLEFAAEGLHRHLLARPEDAALRLATWMLRLPAGGDVATRTIEIIRPTGDSPERCRAIVLAAADGCRLAPLDDAGQPGDMISVGADGLADWLQQAWGQFPGRLADA